MDGQIPQDQLDTVAKNAILPRYYQLLQVFDKDPKSKDIQQAVKDFAKEVLAFYYFYPTKRRDKMLIVDNEAKSMIYFKKTDREYIVLFGKAILQGFIDSHKYYFKPLGFEDGKLADVKSIPAMLEFLAEHEPTSTQPITEEQYQQMMAPYLKE